MKKKIISVCILCSLLMVLITPFSAQAACGYSWRQIRPGGGIVTITCTVSGEHTTGYVWITASTHEQTIHHRGSYLSEDYSYSQYVGSAEDCIPKVDPGYPATCTTSGLTDGSHCALCKQTLVKQTSISPTGHTRVIDPAVPATCTTPGKTVGAHCSTCGAIILAQEEIPAAGNHTEVVDEPYKAATCKEAGHEKKSHCSVCDAILSDGKEIPKLTSHTGVIDEPYKAPTCKEAGHEKKSHCSVCDAVLSDGKEIPKIAHTLVKDAAVAATCTTGGQTEGSHCSACGQVITAQQPTAPAGHNYNEVTVAPTATKDGYILKTCTVCGATEKTVLPATGCKNHYYRTWTANRNHHWAKCVRCGETESLACEYLDFSVSGVQQHICPICGAFANTPFTLVQAKAQGSTLPHGNLVVRQQLVPFGEEAVTLPGVDQPVKVLWAFTTCYEYSGRMQRWNTPVQLTLPANATGTMLIQIDASGNVSPVTFTMVDGNLMVSCPAASIFLMVE